eukprot:371857-Rhodomonas_salina.1
MAEELDRIWFSDASVERMGRALPKLFPPRQVKWGYAATTVCYGMRGTDICGIRACATGCAVLRCGIR